jgi:hypothetical protein
MRNVVHREALIASGLGVGFLLLYLRTLCPTVYLGDSGDLCTAIATGGVAHPPGYPLFTLLGRVALAWIPFGEPAFRIGCVVALAAAGAVTVLYHLTREFDCSPWAAAAGASTFGLSYTFWSQSNRVEVYSLHVLLAALFLLSGVRYRRTGRPGYLGTATMIGSLGLAHHLTIALLVPAFLVLCGRRLCQLSGLGRRLMLLAALLPVGPALYLLLLVWARAEPLHAWGHTVNFSLLWDHASARLYRAWLVEPILGPHLWERMSRAGELFTDNFPYLIFLLPILGAGCLWRQDRVTASAILSTVAGVIIYNLSYAIDDIAPYYLIAWMLAAVLLAVALDTIQRHAWKSPIVTMVALALLLGAPLCRNWCSCDLSRAIWVRELALQKLESAVPRSVLITRGVDDTFPIWYVQDVLKVRPDVFCIDRGTTKFTWLFYDWDPSLWYLYRLRRQGVNAPLERPRSTTGDEEYLIRLLERELRGRPICVAFLIPPVLPNEPTLHFFRWVRERYHVLPLGTIQRLHPKSQPIDLQELLRQNRRLWAKIELPDLKSVRTDQEMAPGYLVNHYAGMLVNYGGLYVVSGDAARAAAVYRRAAEWAPQYRPAVEALAALRSTVENRSHPLSEAGQFDSPGRLDAPSTSKPTSLSRRQSACSEPLPVSQESQFKFRCRSRLLSGNIDVWTTAGLLVLQSRGSFL